MTGDARRARESVLRTFQWIEGDASFTPVFRDADTLGSLGPGLAEPFRCAGVTVVVAPEVPHWALAGWRPQTLATKAQVTGSCEWAPAC